MFVGAWSPEVVHDVDSRRIETALQDIASYTTFRQVHDTNSRGA
jgi:hypothetical protein